MRYSVRFLRPLFVVALAGALSACLPASAQPTYAPGPPETGIPRAEIVAPDAHAAPAPAQHPVLVWTYEDDAVLPELIPALRMLGATGLSMPSHRDLTTYTDAGLQWYADDAAGKSELALAEQTWRTPWSRFWTQRTRAWPSEEARERPACLRDPRARAAMFKRLADAAPRASGDVGGHPAVAISLADEPSMTVRANPVDWCLCERCTKAFRAEQIVAFGGDLDALNRTWETDYRSWDEVLPWTTAAIRARCFGRPPERWNLAPWIATRAFQDKTFADTLGGLHDAAAAMAPGIPCGITGTQAPSAFGGWDYRRLTRAMDFLEPYDIGLALPIARDLGAADLLLAQTVFPSPPNERLSIWRLWRGVARGVDATIVWSSRDALHVPHAPGTVAGVSHYGQVIGPALRALATPGGVGERIVGARPVDGGVRIVVSQPSLAVRWMLDSREDGDTWPRRFGSYEAGHSRAIQSREAAWKALGQQAPRFVDARDLADPAALQGVRLVVLPDILALSDDEVRALSDFADRGGRLVADVTPGTWHADGRPAAADRLPTALLDEGFRHLDVVAARSVGAPILRIEATDDNGDPVAVEVGLRSRDGRTFAVAVPVWDIAVGTGGEASGELPTSGLTMRISFGDGRARDVRDERTSRNLGSVVSWAASCGAEGGAIWSW